MIKDMDYRVFCCKTLLVGEKRCGKLYEPEQKGTLGYETHFYEKEVTDVFCLRFEKFKR